MNFWRNLLGFGDQHDPAGSKVYDGDKKVIRPYIGPGMMSVLIQEP